MLTPTKQTLIATMKAIVDDEEDHSYDFMPEKVEIHNKTNRVEILDADSITIKHSKQGSDTEMIATTEEEEEGEE